MGTTLASSNGTCVSFIDVGKGDCFLLQTGGSAALIDTGYERTSGAVLNHMRQRGVERLEFVIITHYDRDHIGGLRAIASELAVGMVFLPEYIGADKNYRTLMSAVEQLGLPTRRVAEELAVELGDARVDILPSRVAYDPRAKGGDEGNDNDLSLVASFTKGSDSYLFAGDLEREGLASYLGVEGFDGSRGALRSSFDILKMPCHGRKSSLLDEFLEEVRPRIAVITDSADDPADKKAIKQLREIGADIYRTGEHGTIVIAGDGTGTYSIAHSR